MMQAGIISGHHQQIYRKDRMYGPTPENMELILEKSRGKKNGVYRLRGVVYRVAGGKVTHIAHGGTLLECCGHFNVVVGKYSGYEDSAAKALRDI